MPQMSPMNWMAISFFLIIQMKNFNNNQESFLNQKNPPMKIKMNKMKWEW